MDNKEKKELETLLTNIASSCKHILTSTLNQDEEDQIVRDIHKRANTAMELLASLQLTSATAPALTQKVPVVTSSLPQFQGRVLIVDDSNDNQFILSQFLKAAGLETIAAENGRVGVGKALAENYDLILMDMEMPELDGCQATRELREQGYSKPIIALTANSSVKAREQCFDAGCDDYLSKPFEKSHFFSTLGRYLTHRANLSLEEQTRPLVSELLQSDPSSGPLVIRFVDNLAERLSIIKTAHKERDWPCLKGAAHKLISAQLFGFPNLTEVARTLELAAARESLEQASDAVKQLATLCDRIIAGKPTATQAQPQDRQPQHELPQVSE